MKRNLGVVIGILAVLVLFFGGTAIRLYTDWLWFGDLGGAFRSIFSKVIWTKLAMAAVFGGLFFVIVYTNLRIARRLAPPPSRTRAGWEEEVRARVEDFIRRGLGAVILLGSLAIALFVGLNAAGQWEQWLKFANSTPFGVHDPLFRADVGFYVFKLPFYSFVYNWLFGTILVAGLATAILHYVDEGIDFYGNVPRFAPGVKLQLGILVAVLFFLKAVGYKLSMYNLVLAPGRLFDGAGYADVHARLPALWILLVAAIIGGILVLVNIRRRGIMLASGAFVGLLVLSVLVGYIYPSAVESLRVKPNELDAQRPYITLAINATRQAFGVDKIQSSKFDYQPDLTPADFEANRAAVQNIRLWDYEPLRRAYNQLQVFQPYYEFNDVDIDRYMVKGAYRQVMLSARELAGLPSNANTWVNRYLRYTHGYGLAMTPVNEATPEGLPVYFASGIPVATVEGLEVTTPQVYFGETTNDFALVNTKREEFDYAVGGASEITTSYKGDVGPRLNSFFRRLAFAARFGDMNLVLSQDITPGSRILFKRNISDRARTIFPFLTYDRDPYLVTIKGRLYWFLDAYTTTSLYPYSDATEESGIRYIRNSVKIVTDAYSGKVTAYMFDPSDPIIRTYAKAFPGAIRPASEMPTEFRAHVRYPEDLFRVQTEVYARYHQTDPAVFYSGNDLWAIPTMGTTAEQTQGEQLEPYYLITRLPRSTKDEFILVLPFVRPGRPNMVAWISAKCDPEEYGQLISFEFPRGETVFGPAQVMARANQDTVISQQLTLWGQAGSSVVRGSMLAIPISNSILYVEPLYLESTSNQIPEFKRVIVSLGNRLSMEPTLQSALSVLMGGANISVASQTTGIRQALPTAVGGRPAQASEAAQGLIRQANEQFNRSQQALKRGDWTAYGKEMDALAKTLRELQGKSQP